MLLIILYKWILSELNWRMVQLHPDNWECDISASTFECLLVFIKHHLLSFKFLTRVILFCQVLYHKFTCDFQAIKECHLCLRKFIESCIPQIHLMLKTEEQMFLLYFPFLIGLFLSDKHLLGFYSESFQLLWAIWGGFKRLYIFCVEASFNIFREVRRAHNSGHIQGNLNVGPRGGEKCAAVILIKSECPDLEFIRMLFE